MKIPFLNLKKKNVGKKKIFSFLFFLGKDPYRDWKSLIIFFSILFVIVISMNVYLFLGVVRGDLFQVQDDQGVPPKPFDREFMMEVLSDFDAKQKRLEVLKQNNIAISDPSL